VPNIYRPNLQESKAWRRAALGAEAGCEELGVSLYELAPGEGMVFHYHVQREELLSVPAGTLCLRTADGWEDLPEGELVALPRGERGAHGFENRTFFNVQDAVSDYGGKAEIVPPAPLPHRKQSRGHG
jgi:uncharacterized cupin superfamily protein